MDSGSNIAKAKTSPARDWISEHTEFFSRQLAEEGERLSETDEIILERFRLIWPAPNTPNRQPKP